MTSKTTCIARTNRAFVRAVAGFAAVCAHRSLHSRAVVSVVALWFERALAITAPYAEKLDIDRKATNANSASATNVEHQDTQHPNVLDAANAAARPTKAL